MAKRFLETLNDSFTDGALDELIPVERSPRRGAKKPRKPGRRRKAFLEAIDEAFEVKRQETETQPRGSKRSKKSFLSRFDEELDETFFNDLVAGSGGEVSAAEARLITQLDAQLLDQMRSYAQSHGLRIKDVVQEALRIFLRRAE